jgi:hypothetical protein
MSMTSSNKEKTALTGAHDEVSTASVYDFLYHDARRIGSFLAQFDEAGHLQQVTQGDTVAKARRRAWKASVGGSLDNVGVGPSASISLETAPGEAGSMSSSRVYDPLWTNALSFLDYVSEAGLLNTSASNAGMGQLVLIRGGLWIVDTSLLQSMVATPIFKKMVLGSNQGQNRSKAARQNSQPTEMELGIAMMELMPHLIQARISSDGSTYWASLLPDGLTTPPGDLFLKHGLRPAGEWAMVGVLDAVPDQEVEELNVESLMASIELGAYLGGLYPIASGARPMVGRPSHAFGVTPLLIFREVLRGL